MIVPLGRLDGNCSWPRTRRLNYSSIVATTAAMITVIPIVLSNDWRRDVLHAGAAIRAGDDWRATPRGPGPAAAGHDLGGRRRQRGLGFDLDRGFVIIVRAAGKGNDGLRRPRLLDQIDRRRRLHLALLTYFGDVSRERLGRDRWYRARRRSAPRAATERVLNWLWVRQQCAAALRGYKRLAQIGPSRLGCGLYEILQLALLVAQLGLHRLSARLVGRPVDRHHVGRRRTTQDVVKRLRCLLGLVGAALIQEPCRFVQARVGLC
jgi:hypothetical protein